VRNFWGDALGHAGDGGYAVIVDKWLGAERGL